MLKKSDDENAYWCVVSGSELWTVDGALPQGTAQQLGLDKQHAYVIGSYHERPIYWINEADVEQALNMSSLRTLLDLEPPLFHAASRAVQYGHMVNTQRFCAQCGGRNHFHPREYAMQCHDCRTMHYPRIFPCIIVAVRRNQQLLLAQHLRHKNPIYTVIAGFVETGETLEDCVRREVEEETGLKVNNIRYVASQPWAFPSSLMVGFLADYVAGEIRIDKTELKHADWFSPDNLPAIPPQGTIARQLIQTTLDEIRQDTHATSQDMIESSAQG